MLMSLDVHALLGRAEADGMTTILAGPVRRTTDRLSSLNRFVATSIRAFPDPGLGEKIALDVLATRPLKTAVKDLENLMTIHRIAPGSAAVVEDDPRFPVYFPRKEGVRR